ncbi:hypothetical protein FRC00_008547 [Tulasnella sp. 408]|nr:hypothetical protein FRC00_008547 [Tulasnella sp. 408]
MPAASRPEDSLRRHAALYTRLMLSGTTWELEFLESDVACLEKNVVQGGPMVNFHLASIYNRYNEIFPGSPPEVVLLPDFTYTGWKKKQSERPDTGLVSWDIGKACHVAFPFYWEAQGRWMLVVLAYIHSLLPLDDAAGTADRESNFGILILDALNFRPKTSYSSLQAGFRGFTKALLQPRLDLKFDAIEDAQLVAPVAPLLTPEECQAAQPGHYLKLLLGRPSEFITSCRLGRMTEPDWDVAGRKEAVTRFAAFLSTQSSLAMANIKWKQANPGQLRAGTALPGPSPKEPWKGDFA